MLLSIRNILKLSLDSSIIDKPDHKAGDILTCIDPHIFNNQAQTHKPVN